MLPFPNIDPVALELGPLVVRWYSLAYMVGIIGGWWLLGRMQQRYQLAGFNKTVRDDLILWAVLGIIIGGRMGYALFYNWSHFSQQPLDILRVWQGGMAFHGGLVGFAVALYLFARRKQIRFFALTDRIACVVPLGLFCGRIANFINGELFGRVTDAPLGMIFPAGGPLPRHPSQLYQAGLEGAALGLLLWICLRYTNMVERPGKLTGVFLMGYGSARMIGEFFRQPDPQLGFLFAGATMGQLLSLPMILIGMGVYGAATRK